MAKMTQARVDRWQKDLEKAAQLVRKTAQDVGSAKLTTSGSIYSQLVELGGLLVPMLNGLDGLTAADQDRSPLHRARTIVRRAADERKARRAAKAAGSSEANERLQEPA